MLTGLMAGPHCGRDETGVSRAIRIGAHGRRSRSLHCGGTGHATQPGWIVCSPASWPVTIAARRTAPGLGWRPGAHRPLGRSPLRRVRLRHVGAAIGPSPHWLRRPVLIAAGTTRPRSASSSALRSPASWPVTIAARRSATTAASTRCVLTGLSAGPHCDRDALSGARAEAEVLTGLAAGPQYGYHGRQEPELFSQCSPASLPVLIAASSRARRSTGRTRVTGPRLVPIAARPTTR